jgi:hypothetical protein
MIDAQALTAAAEAAVVTLEALPEGEPFAVPVEAAQRALDALHGRAAGELFPPGLPPLQAGVPEYLAASVDFMATTNIVDALAGVHAAALAGGNDDLARAVRSPLALGLLRQSSARMAVLLARAEGEQLAMDHTRYEVAISRQLAARGEGMPWSEVLSETLPALRARLAAARARLEAAAAAAIAQAQQDAADAQRLLAEVSTERRRALAERLKSLGNSRYFGLPGYTYDVPAGTVGALLSQGEFDADVLSRLERELDAREAQPR